MDYREIVRFHGHECPGLATGYRMTLAAMEALKAVRSEDEEIAAIVENDACGVDALQCLTGCTFGKGNLIFHDYGKPVFTLYSRAKKTGVRVAFHGRGAPDEVRADRDAWKNWILNAPAAEMLSLSHTAIKEPERAKIRKSADCAFCGESAMETRIRQVAGKSACIPCANLESRHDKENEMMNGENHVPFIGSPAPAFEAETTQGKIEFPKDYKGKWVIFFSHPADFTPVCTTEFMTFASMAEDFKALNCELLGLSIDSTFSHIAWLRTIKEKIEYKGMKNIEVMFPVISDLTMEVSKKYGMLQPSESTTQAVRSVFIIDPKGTVRCILHYPLSNGRNIPEINRILVAMQHADEHQIATPANWELGDDVIIPPPGSCGTAKERVENAGSDYKCLDWFLCLKECPHGN